MLAEIAEATDPDFIWGALDNVHDADTTLDDYAAAVSRAQRAALLASSEEARQFLRQRDALRAEIEAMRSEAEVRNEGFALGWKAAIEVAGEVCEHIRIGIANGPMPEGARFDYEQSVRDLTPPTDAQAALDAIEARVRAEVVEAAFEIWNLWDKCRYRPEQPDPCYMDCGANIRALHTPASRAALASITTQTDIKGETK